MLRKASATKGILLLGAMIMSTAYAAESETRIRSVFDINDAFCIIKTNDVPGMDNRESALAGRGLGTSSTNAMLVLENGENDITVEVGALGWFSESDLSEKEREKFSSDSSCKLALTLFEGEKKEVLSQLNITVDKNGIPQAGNDRSVIVKKILAQQVEKGHIKDSFFIDKYFPKDMTLYQFTKKVSLKGLPEWRWIKATPYTGQPQQLHALQKTYMEFWSLFSKKDNKTIQNTMKDLLNAWSITTGSSTDEIYNSQQFVDDFKNPGFEMVPINWNDYTVEVMNKGRLVRFVNKSDPTIYPLSYYIKDENGERELRWFTPIFSLVDGKFIPVI